LRELGIGFEAFGNIVPLVPTAILFDLVNGGDQDWGLYSPYRELGYQAAANAAADFSLGSVGAGTGATVAGLKGGLGSASTVANGITIGALAAVNGVGSVTIGKSRHFWAAPFEVESEFGGLGLPQPLPADTQDIAIKRRPSSAIESTTIAVIATDAVLTKADAKRLAIAAHDGFARAMWPSHTPFDGDLVFALATGGSGIVPDPGAAIDLYAAASATMTRAIARGVYAATARPADRLPVWSSR
jgi:L-aminopeptidase/D-esterase-like protein